eukprot:RCo026874
MSELSTPVGIREIAKDVAHRPGTSAGLTVANHMSVWRALCRTVEETMKTKKGVMVAGFAHFGFHRHEVAMGPYGTQVTLSPAFSFHPTFCSQFGVSPGRHSRTGPTPTVLLSYNSVAAYSGLNVDSATNSLKDLIRRIGEIASQGSFVLLDFEICQVNVRNRRPRVTWNAEFLRILPDFDVSRISAHSLSGLPTYSSKAAASLLLGSGLGAAEAFHGLKVPKFATSAELPGADGRLSRRASPSRKLSPAKRPASAPRPSVAGGPIIAVHSAGTAAPVPAPRVLSPSPAPGPASP